MEPETKARGDQSPKAAMDQRAKETAGVLKVKEVEAEVVVGGSSEEAPLLAHPWCSLLQLLLRTCAGCLGLHGYCSDDDPKPVAADGDDDLKPVAEDAAAQAVVAETLWEGGGGGEASSYLYLQEVSARVRKPTPPPPKGGSGDDGGKHH